MSDGFKDFLEDQFAAIGGVTIRRMFGGLGVFRDGVMFGLVSDDTLYFRVDESNRPQYEAEELAPFVYPARGREMEMPYWRAPEMLFDNADAFGQWAEAAFAAAVKAKADKPVKRKSRSKKRG